MHHALSSALSLHSDIATDDVSNTTKGDAKTNLTVETTPSSRQRTSIQVLTVHPSLPRVAYLAEESSVSETILSQQQLPPTSKKNKATTIAEARRSIGSVVKTQRVIIQQYHRDSQCNLQSLGEDNMLASLPMETLPPQLNRFRQPRSKTSKLSIQPLTLATLGPLQSITFLDREALFWQTRRGYGAQTNLESGGGLSSTAKEGVTLHADSYFEDCEGGLGHGLCLGLQFTRTLVVLRFNDATSNAPFTILCCLEGQRSTAGNGKESSSQYTPTSAVVPITNSVVVYGCSDGAMRFHNLLPSLLYSSKIEALSSLTLSTSLTPPASVKSQRQTRQATIKSVRGPNGRNDPVVKVMNVDPAFSGIHHAEGVRQPFTGSNAVVTSNATALVLRARLLTACSSGAAYLWDVYVQLDRSSGAVRDLIVQPPLVRLDGLGSLTVSPRKAPSVSSSSGGKTISHGGGFWGNAAASKSSSQKKEEVSTKAPYFDVTPAITYDPHRNLLVWKLPSNAPVTSIDHRGDFKLESLTPNSPAAKKEAEDNAYLNKWSIDNGGFVKVWDFSLVDSLALSSTTASSSPQPPPKFAPAAVMKLSPSVSDKMVTGVLHSPVPTSSLACTCLSKSGSELMVQSAPLPGVAARIDDKWIVQSSSSSASGKSNQRSAGVEKMKTLFINFTTHYTVPVTTLARGSALSASASSPDYLAIATDRGVFIACVADGELWHTDLNTKAVSSNESSHHASLSSNTQPGPLYTIISGGPVGSLNNRPGVLFIENDSVYASRLETSRAVNENKSLVERVGLQDPMLLHTLQGKGQPWFTTRSTRISNFAETYQPIQCPPRLIASPSGRYLCLFWEDQMRYEILHAASLLTRDAASGFGGVSETSGQGVSPSVDSGNRVLSFAWIGDDDRFAILRHDDLRPLVSVSPNAPSSPRKAAAFVSPKPEVRREALKRLFSPASNGSDVGVPANDVASPMNKGEQVKPRVELKKLAEVRVDAVELAAGASVAAATTVNLGNLIVRGGDRAVPMVLFGGPSLCVSCVSVSDRSEQLNTNAGDSIAYFYSRKSGAIKEHDERASSYMTVGPSIASPDLLSWDDDGRLCAMAVGSRVAIYLSEPPKFHLLGSVNIVGTRSFGTEMPLISIRFIHAVLYCSTQSSVHVIFLGDLKDEDTVCELDVFTLASDCLPPYGVDNPTDSSPIPAVTSLMYPHILTYHSGGLLVSTSSGLRLIPMSHPLIRIGTLLGANLVEKARKWVLASPKSEHDSMANFLIRRGHTIMALRDLDGLSVETYIDLCMRYEYTEELEQLLDENGSQLLPEICDWKRGHVNGGYSAIFCIGVYMIGKNRLECAKKLAEQMIGCGINEVLSDAMKLALLIGTVDKDEGKALLQQASDAMVFDANGQMPLVNVIN